MPKTKKMETMLNQLSLLSFGRSREDFLCVTCGSTDVRHEHFRDDLSRKEFGISRMCQKCQDSIFEGGEE